MAKKKTLNKEKRTGVVRKKKTTTKATTSKKKVASARRNLRGKKFPNGSKVWVDVDSHESPFMEDGKLVIKVHVSAKGAANSFDDFDYQSQYVDESGRVWQSETSEAIPPTNTKKGTVKFTYITPRSSGSSSKEDAELSVTILTTKSNKPNL
jgi:hypothetical protein